MTAHLLESFGYLALDFVNDQSRGQSKQNQGFVMNNFESHGQKLALILFSFFLLDLLVTRRNLTEEEIFQVHFLFRENSSIEVLVLFDLFSIIRRLI